MKKKKRRTSRPHRDNQNRNTTQTVMKIVKQGADATSKDDLDRAIAKHTETLRLDPSNVNAYMSRGFACAEQGNWEGARADFAEVVHLDPTNVDAYLNMASACAGLGNIDQAIAECAEAIRLDPTNVDAYMNRGMFYNSKNNPDRALEDLNEAIRLKPDYALAYVNRGNIYESKKDYDRACAEWEYALKLDFRVPFARENLRRLHRENEGDANAAALAAALVKNHGDIDKAIADLNKALGYNAWTGSSFNSGGIPPWARLEESPPRRP